MDANKMKELFSDQAFVKCLMESDTVAQVQAELKKKGLDLSEQDVIKIRDGINKHLENGTKPEELSLDQLDDVAGGAIVGTLIGIAIDVFSLITQNTRLRW